ncbi:sigma-70 family RNA polymerase sigma factor [Saccharophagus degradans]|uniref:Sigma-70 family RNA polymerase sigma factor n=1 Tax=Saccharophagus degradans TaxID=86304 RepID=A0AAW7XAU2_9GAMM|nr:sigma-70 family RNA polymerase sigma factor [Saccharophagus degradans]MBU2987547.1 sigma-70 family RNA polymerase sigma factor [Saccharophagus degradans]MDO6424720.1 sigma-70 family RNA polymerase sigma factor [Saccharophagus degradans]MDO6609528.1 sigma-70 family RNA polymerase sigma factor [Saccharophagus degradans]
MEFQYRTYVNQYQRLVYSKALHMLGNSAEAEDACQEVYERLWKHISKVEDHHAKAWLLHVTGNVCIDQLRKRTDTQALDEELVCERSDGNPSNALANSQLSHWLTNALSKMKEPYKSLIQMAEIQQQSVKYIAQHLGLSENQVKVYGHRARQQLRALLQGVDL